jgi:hypothetical protein
VIHHPEKYPAQIFRAMCVGINQFTQHLELDLDLGFDIRMRVCGLLDNLSTPRYQPEDPNWTESHAHEALITRISELIWEKPVLVMVNRRVAFHPMPPEYTFSVFFYAVERKGNWHSLEDQLVREKHAAWVDASLPVPSIG